jgi:hypothetical protein
LTPTGTLSGTVTYRFFLNGNCTNPASTRQTVTIAGGVIPPSSATGSLAAGQYSFQANFVPGNGNYKGSVSTCEPFAIGATTLTPGYWKNHLSVTDALIQGHQPFYLGDYLISGTNAQISNEVTAIFNGMNCSTSSAQNAIGCLTGQLLAALLNVDNLAPTSIAPTISAAQQFLGIGGVIHTVTYGGHIANGVLYTGPGNYKLSATQRQVAISLANDLSAYNASGN